MELYKESNYSDFNLKIEERESSLKLRQNWHVEDRHSEYIWCTKDNNLITNKVLIKTQGGNMDITADYVIHNETQLDISFEDCINIGKYKIKSGKNLFMAHKKNRYDDGRLKINVSTNNLNGTEVLLSEYHQHEIITMQLSKNEHVKIHFSLKKCASIFVVHIKSLWNIRNNTEREFLVQGQSINKTKKWVSIPAGQLKPFYVDSEEPILVLRDSLEACQTDEFKISKSHPKRTLRLSKNSGLTLNLRSSVGTCMIIEIDETKSESGPFTFENHSSELVIKLKQDGEKQVFKFYYYIINNYLIYLRCLFYF